MILTVISLLLVNQALAISQNTECHSNNDPHMQNFNFNNFEFQNVGNFCMYNSGKAQIQAGFAPCSAFSQSPTCNCMIKVSIPNTPNYAMIDICTNYNGNNNNYAIQTNLGTLQCAMNVNFINLFDDNDWAPITSNHGSFKCVITNMGFIALRTTLASSNDDVLIKIYDYLNSVQIYPSNDYVSNSIKNYDSCLCGTSLCYSGLEGKIPKTQPILICKEALIAKKGLTDFIKNLNADKKTAAKVNEFVELVNNCALDLELMQTNRLANQKLEVGKFQKNLVYSKVIETILGGSVKTLSKTDEAWKTIQAICKSINKIPNEKCLIFGKCVSGFELCTDLDLIG